MFLRACVRVCVCVRATFCVYVSMCGTLYRPKERSELSGAFEFIPGHPFTMFSISLYDDIRRKEASQKRICEFFVLIEHLLRPLFVSIREVQEMVSERIEKVPGR